MGESEVLLCPHLYLEDNGKTRKRKNSKFNSATFLDADVTVNTHITIVA